MGFIVLLLILKEDQLIDLTDTPLWMYLTMLIVWLWIIGGWCVVSAAHILAKYDLTTGHRVIAYIFWPFICTYVFLFDN